jgi:zinc transporter
VSAEPHDYGSDRSGLIVGYLFEADGISKQVDTVEVEDFLGGGALPRSEGRFAWLHFNGANDATARWLQANCDLPEPFFESLAEGEQSTRVEFSDESLVAVLNDVIYEFAQADSSQVSTLWSCVKSGLLVTVRRKPLRSIDRLRRAVRAQEPFQSPLALFKHLLHDQGDVLLEIIRRTARKVDGIEDQLLAGRLNTRRMHLGTLRRDLVRLQRLLAPEPAALFRLLNRPPGWMAEEDAMDLRQRAEEFSLIVHELASLQERIKLLQEEIVANIGERTGRTVFVLTAVTVLALPVNMVAGLFGMNVGGVPYGQDPEGFWIVVGVVAMLSSLAAWLVFRERRD